MSLNKRKLRMGMIGGGVGAFIGAVHRLAANLDGQIELVCGALAVIRKSRSKQEKSYFLIHPVFMAHILR